MKISTVNQGTRIVNELHYAVILPISSQIGLKISQIGPKKINKKRINK